MPKKRWADLSEPTRRAILVGAALEGTLKIAALKDLKRRTPAEVKGPRWKWAAAILLANSAGLVPLAYFIYGRRRTS